MKSSLNFEISAESHPQASKDRFSRLPEWIVVTGSEGYIGQRLVRNLILQGFRVKGIDLGLFPKNMDFDAPKSASYELITRDIRHVDPHDLEGYSTIIHLGALSNDPTSEIDQKLTYSINTLACKNLARTAKSAGIKRIIFLSSCSVYGQGTGLLDEKGPTKPISAYAKSKLQAERLLQEEASSKLKVVVLRNATVFGPSSRMRLDLVINQMVLSALATGRIAVCGDPGLRRPLVFVEDIAKAIIEVMTALDIPSYVVYNTGRNENNLTIDEMATIVCEKVGARVFYDENASDFRSYSVDFSQFQKKFPKIIVTGLEEGIDRLIMGYTRNKFHSQTLEDSTFYNMKFLSSRLYLFSNRIDSNQGENHVGDKQKPPNT